MEASTVPAFFMPLFFGAFAVNAAYIVSLFTLKHRLAATPQGGFTKQIFGASPVELFQLLAFVFSGRHAGFADPAISRLTWTVRVLFIAGAVGTAAVFAFALGAV